jgi:D-tyrosyl-tRNA(Tyr) deacylase
MRAVLQRVSSASVIVENEPIAEIRRGIVALVAVRNTDSEKDAQWIANKISELRIFEDDHGKMNLSVQDVAGEILLVSNFTLYGDAQKGRRPSFTAAASYEQGAQLLEAVVANVSNKGIKIQTGAYGRQMDVHIVNDGPITLVIESGQ